MLSLPFLGNHPLFPVSLFTCLSSASRCPAVDPTIPCRESRTSDWSEHVLAESRAAALLTLPLVAIRRLAQPSWLGFPLRWLFPASVSLWSGNLLPTLAAEPLHRVWLGVACWALVAFALRGAALSLLVLWLFSGSLALYVWGVLQPLFFDRGRGIVQAALCLTTSPYPGFLWLFQGVTAVVLGPGIAWTSFAAFVALLLAWSSSPRHIYQDLEDHLVFRYGVSAPLWSIILAGAGGSILVERIFPLGGPVHLLGAVGGAVGIALLFFAGAAGRRVIVWSFRRLRAAFLRVFRSPSVPPKPSAPVPPQPWPGVASQPPVAASSAASGGGSPAAGAVAAAALPVNVPAAHTVHAGGPAPVVAQGLAAVSEEGGIDGLSAEDLLVDGADPRFGSSLPPPGRLGGGHNAPDVDHAEEESMTETPVMSDDPGSVAVFWLQSAIEHSLPENLGGLMELLLERWDEADSHGPESAASIGFLASFGSMPLGRILLQAVRDRLSPLEALDLLRASRSRDEFDSRPDAAIDWSLRPLGAAEFSTRLDGGGDDRDLRPPSEPDATAGSDEWAGLWRMDSEPAVGGLRDQEVHNLAAPGSVVRIAEYQPPVRMPGPVPSSAEAFDSGSPAAIPSSAVPSGSLFGGASPSGPTVQKANVGGVTPSSRVADRPAEKPLNPGIAAAGPSDAVDLALPPVGPDFSLGVGESNSEAVEHPLEMEGDFAHVLAAIEPMDRDAAVALLTSAAPWLPGFNDLAGRISVMVDALTPDADDLAKFMAGAAKFASAVDASDSSVAAALLFSLARAGAANNEREWRHRVRKVAYAICGPHRRALHANVGRVIAAGPQFASTIEGAAKIDELIGALGDVLELFPSYSISGAAGSLIESRRAELQALREAGDESVRTSRAKAVAGERSFVSGRGLALRSSLDPAAEMQLASFERLSAVYFGLQDTIAADCVLDGAPQDSHPLSYSVKDLLAQGAHVLDRFQRAVSAYELRHHIPVEAGVSLQVIGTLHESAQAFVADVRRSIAEPTERPLSSRTRILGLTEQLESALAREEERRLASQRTPRQLMDDEWIALEVDPFEAVVRRKALQDSMFELVEGAMPEWAMVQLREFRLPVGLRVFLNESGYSPDVHRVMIVPLAGQGLVWTADDRGLVPVGAGFLRFDLLSFLEDNRVSIRSQRIHDVKVLIANGSVSPDVEDILLSSSIERVGAVSRESLAQNPFQGVVLRPQDLLGLRGGVALQSGLYFSIADMSGRGELRVAS